VEDWDRLGIQTPDILDYLCAECGNVLATGMNPEHMGRRVRIKCGRCRTVNIAAEVPVEPARRPRR